MVAIVVLTTVALPLAGGGMAANGQSLTLGKADNSATLKTGLSASINDQALQLTNTNSNSGATALGLTVASGRAPLVVNSAAGKATNLNADKLDGLDSNGFWKLGGNGVSSAATLGTTTNQALVLKVDGKQALVVQPKLLSPNLIGGYSANTVVAGAAAATISGGGTPGAVNQVSDDLGTVGGGEYNSAGNLDGDPTNATGATVAGGSSNTASGFRSAVGGGFGNAARGAQSVVAGGSSNTASGLYSAVAGGYGNIASGTYSLAAGHQAVADDDGAFVWNDGNWAGGSVYSPAAHSFSVHATGGFNFWTNAVPPTTGCWIAAGGGSLNCSSSRKVKKEFAPVDRATLLRRLNGVPVTTWSYKHEKPGVRHIGPMAQDFKRAFRVGEDDTSIAMVDADGVSLAAIQGLYRENVALRRRLSRQGARLLRLERLVETSTRSHQ